MKRATAAGNEPATILHVIMLVKVGEPERRENWLPRLWFLLVTVIPWAVLLWLMWPRR